MAWHVERREPMEFKTEQEQRLTDLALALVIPWKDGFPQVFWQTATEEKRLAEIIEATKSERLPWELRS